MEGKRERENDKANSANKTSSTGEPGFSIQKYFIILA